MPISCQQHRADVVDVVAMHHAIEWPYVRDQRVIAKPDLHVDFGALAGLREVFAPRYRLDADVAGREVVPRLRLLARRILGRVTRLKPDEMPVRVPISSASSSDRVSKHFKALPGVALTIRTPGGIRFAAMLNCAMNDGNAVGCHSGGCEPKKCSFPSTSRMIEANHNDVLARRTELPDSRPGNRNSRHSESTQAWSKIPAHRRRL